MWVEWGNFIIEESLVMISFDGHKGVIRHSGAIGHKGVNVGFILHQWVYGPESHQRMCWLK